jgi:hypothetical protein
MIKEAEKDQVIAKVKDRINLGEEIIYGETDHFIVIYRGGNKVYKNFGSFLDTNPSSLAQFLEYRSLKMLERLDLGTEIKSVHVVEVGHRKGVLGLLTSGTYRFNKYEGFGDTEWEHVRFSEIGSGKSPDCFSSYLPKIFNTAAHEVIGHSIIQPLLMPQLGLTGDDHAKNFLGSASEGAPVFIENEAVGIDSHLQYAHFLSWALATDPIFRMGLLMSQIEDWSVRWGNERSEQTEKLLRETEGISLPISKIFDVDWEKDTQIDFVHYPRGASLNKIILDEFGTAVYKRWASQVTRENYRTIIPVITGVSAEDFKGLWKERVLSKMTDLSSSGSYKPIPVILNSSKVTQQIVDHLRKYS